MAQPQQVIQRRTVSLMNQATHKVVEFAKYARSGQLEHLGKALVIIHEGFRTFGQFGQGNLGVFFVTALLNPGAKWIYLEIRDFLGTGVLNFRT